MKVPILDNRGRKTGEYAPMVCNLTRRATPAYNNDGGELGLTRTDSGILVIVYTNMAYMGCSFAEEIGEAEAYDLCMKNNQTHLIDALRIEPDTGDVIL